MGFVGSCIDIQEMVEASEALANLNATLERRVEERTAQLADVNRELESFAYSVSHDLRAPLRQIGSYAELIRNELPAELVRGRSSATSASSRGRRARPGARARRARVQPRVGRGLSASRVRARELVGRSCSGCCRRAQRPVHWEIGALPEVTADAHAAAPRVPEPARERAEVHREAVRARDPRRPHALRASEHVFSVGDNGIGFDPRQSPSPVQAVPAPARQEECRGSGIGLANVARIVKRHGGRVWAEGRSTRARRSTSPFPAARASRSGRLNRGASMLPREAWLDLARKLDWTFRYVSESDLFPGDPSGETRVPPEDWRRWEEPFKTSYREYVAAQHDKERAVRAVREAVGRPEHQRRIPRPWLNANKFHGAALPLAEFAATIGNLRAGASRATARGGRWRYSARWTSCATPRSRCCSTTIS
jgi:hypothetical protein